MSADVDTSEIEEPFGVVEILSPKQNKIFSEFCNPEENSDLKIDPLLPMDHPLMIRYQKNLKEHLLRIKAQLTDEVDEMEHNIKQQEKQREEIGARLYDLQQKTEKQTKDIEEFSKNIQETTAKRIEEEAKRDSLRKEYDEQQSLHKERKLKHNQSLIELDHLQELENNMKKWADEYETELKTSKRILSKDAQLQKAKAEEKVKADLVFFNLQNEVKKCQEESEGLAQQIKDQTELNNSLESSLSDANVDLETLQQEHKRINQAWGEVIVAIQHRDKVLQQAREMLQKQKEALQVTNMSIERTKKEIDKENERTDTLESSGALLNKQINSLKREIDKQEKAIALLELKMEELPKIMEQMEKDYQEAKKEGHQINIELNAIESKLKKQNAIKIELEESILKTAQEELMCEKACKHRLKVLTEHQEVRRKMEDDLQKIETQLSNMLLELESEKNAILNLNEEGDALKAKLKERSDELDALNNEVKVMDNQMALKAKEIDKASKILNDLVKECDGHELSPNELKVKNLEKTLQETEQKIKEQQKIWMTLQENFLRLSEKRSKQLNDMQVASKQLMIINQKSLKIDSELEEAEKKEQEVDREIQSYSTKLELLNAKCFKSKKEVEAMESDFENEHSELLQKLKDGEMKVLELEQNTIELTKEIEHQKNIVLEKHREALSWETKYKLLDETLRWQKKEKAADSEIGQMKAEIHRMEIRYKELKSAQQKLAQDLDHTIMHRERIFELASIREKTQGNRVQTRTNTQQKIKDIERKLKKVNKDIVAAEKEFKELTKEHTELEEAKAKIEKEIEERTNQDKLIKNEIEQGMLLKYQNLDTIVRKQNRAKAYKKLAASTSALPKLPRSEAAIELGMQKEIKINNDLSEIVDTLLVEFPEKKFILTRLAQTLKD